ncbi:MAG: DUF3106 domain-containing protein [Candidatus Riflebacteria bacterium]|nr:DUF3106 domain-containing protein [Candidatus Riflebacteria bacterium]
MLVLAALLAGGDIAAQNASETREIRKLSYEEKLARWNSMSEEQREAIRQKARSISEKKFKQLENNFERASNLEPAEQQRVKQNFGRIKQFKPQQQQKLRQRFQQFQRLPEERRQQFRRQFIPNFKPRPEFMPQHRPGQWQNQSQRPGQAQPPQQRPDQWQSQQRPGQARQPQGQGEKPNRPPGFTPGVFPDAQNRQPHDKKPVWGDRQHPDRQPGGQNGHMPGRPQPGQHKPGMQGNRQPVKPGNDKQPGQPGQPLRSGRQGHQSQQWIPDQNMPEQPPGQPGQTGYPFRPGRSGQQGQNWTPDQNRPGQQPGQQEDPGRFRPRGQPGRFDMPGQREQFRPDMSGPQGMPPRRPPPFRPRRHGDVREFRRGMMGDGSHNADNENFQRRWQDVEKFREGFNQSETDGQQPHFPGPRRFSPPGRDDEPGQQKPENLPDGEMQRPDRPRLPEGMREGDKRPWPGPGPRQFKRPDPPSDQPGGKQQGSENRPFAPVLKNRPPVKSPAGNPQPQGPKPGQRQAPNPPPKP